MKKIYLSILAITLAFTASAQLTLTKAFNEPVLGNVNTKNGYDSTGILPKSTGAGQNWNFSTLTTNTIVDVSTYTTVASTPSAASFPSATIAEDQGSGNYNYHKSTATQFELVGFSDPSTIASFTNSAIEAIWPMSFGYSNTDAFAGTVTSGTMSGPVNGTIVTSGSGTGTITLPGSITLTNILQLKVSSNSVIYLPTSFGTATIATISTDYQYYSGTQKFPVLDISYQKQTVTTILGPTVTLTADIRINNSVLTTGINELNFDNAYSVYPNPASGIFNIALTNAKAEDVSVEIVNQFGQSVKKENLGNGSNINSSINTAGLTSGVYFVRTTMGNKSSVKKLIIE